jgi:hypothetical protein
MKDPKDFICPKCRASIGGKCLEAVQDGSKYIDHFHEERIQKASE